MALVSPGISISINDQSQYVNSNVGSVPLVVLATAQDKSYNGSYASGTSAAMAGMLQSFTSQRDLVTAMGTPTFQLSSAGTPVNASELNEYGLLTAYSALGISNQLFAIRADIDLDQLIGTSVRPTGVEADGTYWLNTASTEFGIYSLNSTTSSFSSIDSLLSVITNPADVNPPNGNGVSVPLSSYGNQGSYAIVATTATGTVPARLTLFYKATALSTVGGTGTPANNANNWVQVGGSLWQNAVPVVQGTVTNPTLTGSSTLTINGVGVTTGAGDTTLASLVTDINNMNITGVTAVAYKGQLTFFVTSSASSTGSTADGKLILVDGTGTPLAKCGVTAGSYYCPYFFYGTYAQTPSGGWFSSDSQQRPTGSIWWKTTETGTGWNPTLTQYSASTDTWVPLSVPFYSSYTSAIYGLDPVGGGLNIPVGTVFANYSINNTNYFNEIIFAVKTAGSVNGQAVGTGVTPTSFTSGQTFTVLATQPGNSSFLSYTVTLGTTGWSGSGAAANFVADILYANIPYVTAQVNSNGTISIIHTTGGQIQIVPGAGYSTVLSNAGLTASGTGITVNTQTGGVYINNFTQITSEINYSTTTPYANPVNGTLWYYSNPADVDIMINNNGWKGYQQVTSDVRGYNLQNTDPNGVIVSATKPTSQSTGSSLVPGDLWLDSSDLVNYPSLYRCTAVTSSIPTWTPINNEDHVSNNGIIFADARWDTTGTTDIIDGSFPSIQSLLNSSYIDQDAPDYRLYPRGTLLFNTRRSGYNVKKFVANYFNATSFPLANLPTVPGASSSLPTVTNAWVSASGLNESGVMYAGAAAQRNLVVTAMQSAVNSNTDVLDANYKFNLLVAPGYPELIPSLVTLNDNRGDTGFVIGDTPMTLAPTATELTNWNNNTGDYAGTGLATASPYLAVYYPAGLTTDLAGNTVAVPASHAVLRTYLYNDQVSYPWFAPAGVTRGLVSNLSDIGYVNAETGAFVHNGINQGLRDTLYQLDINPITQLPGTGLVVWGQETRSGDSTARNRVNVVRLENYLRVIFASVSNAFLFEPNDTITRKSIASQIESALNNLLSLRGLYDFLVICDTSNNTSATIANNQLYVDVAIEPMRDVEFIYIPIAIYNPGTIASLGQAST